MNQLSSHKISPIPTKAKPIVSIFLKTLPEPGGVGADGIVESRIIDLAAKFKGIDRATKLEQD
ncbi:hypothetical protein C2U68_13820 [Methylomonas koyamae]|nr:hypothetical protein C2U68_13820 [Methylomonas koyamae]